MPNIALDTLAAAGPAWMQAIPALSFWQILGLAIGTVALVAGLSGAFTAAPEDAGEGLAAQLAAAEAAHDRAGHWLIVALAAPFLGAGIWGLIGMAGGGIAGAVIGALAWAAVSDAHATVAGLKVAQAEHGAAVHAAQQQVQAPDPAQYDPHGMGIAPPAAPAPELPAEPKLSKTDAQRWGRLGSAIDFPPGSASAAILDADGGTSHADSLWAQVAELANLGSAEERVGLFSGKKNVFVPAADLVRVEPLLPPGDVRLVVQPRDLKVGAAELARAIPYLLRLGRIRSAGQWERDHISDTFSLTLTNRDTTADKASPKPASDGEWV